MEPEENYKIVISKLNSGEELSRPEIRRNPLEGLRNILDAYESSSVSSRHKSYQDHPKT